VQVQPYVRQQRPLPQLRRVLVVHKRAGALEPQRGGVVRPRRLVLAVEGAEPGATARAGGSGGGRGGCVGAVAGAQGVGGRGRGAGAGVRAQMIRGTASTGGWQQG
jgi:hypothetical protein